MGYLKKTICLCMTPCYLYLLYTTAMVLFVSYLSLNISYGDECSPALDRALDVVQNRMISVNGVQLNLWEGGNVDGEKLVVFVHGFPETALMSWKHQFPYFAENTDFRFVAPDTRGVNTSDTGDVYFSNSARAAEDIVALIHALGYEKAFVVGHDWGALVSWDLANRFPEVVEKLAILNVPNAHGMKRASATTLQLLRSWYMLFFQLPSIPEYMFLNYMGKVFVKDTVSCQRDLELLEKSWERSISSMINYYRYIPRGLKNQKDVYIEPETLIIWGDKDIALSKEGGEYSLEVCRDGSIIYLDAGHFVQHQAPEQVNEHLVKYLKK
eukprot:TRINITY_DN9396_c0_g1_i1.p1 TRINITY_DN9396_c0_g1~~TRINITY_DN9396_c0_g1_i1.p1  ORF type:complete len:341 (+),score=58.10 TRINITY_DN9396_c0_g1_i1:47-1024(+)